MRTNKEKTLLERDLSAQNEPKWRPSYVAKTDGHIFDRVAFMNYAGENQKDEQRFEIRGIKDIDLIERCVIMMKDARGSLVEILAKSWECWWVVRFGLITSAITAKRTSSSRREKEH